MRAVAVRSDARLPVAPDSPEAAAPADIEVAEVIEYTTAEEELAKLEAQHAAAQGRIGQLTHTLHELERTNAAAEAEADAVRREWQEAEEASWEGVLRLRRAVELRTFSISRTSSMGP